MNSWPYIIPRIISRLSKTSKIVRESVLSDTWKILLSPQQWIRKMEQIEKYGMKI